MEYYLLFCLIILGLIFSVKFVLWYFDSINKSCENMRKERIDKYFNKIEKD